MFNCAIFVFGHLVIATIVQALPETLTITIKDTDEYITINWKFTQQYLANENLPIWYAWKNKEPELQHNVMNNIGPFAMYHDVDKSSAVVYFQNTGGFFGIIDTRFLIYDLPLSEIQPGIVHIVNGPYVKRRLGIIHHDDLMDFLFDNISPSSLVSSLSPVDLDVHAKSQTSLCNYLQNIYGNFHQTHHGTVDVLYPEILVFIPNHIAKQFKTAMSLVAFYLVQFNAVDMLFAKLKEDGVVIHINIAGLVLEAEEEVFPYVFISEQSQPTKVLDGPATLEKFPTYLKKYEDVFVEDSFDFFFLSTEHYIKFEDRYVDGLARMDLNVFELRSSKSYYETHYDSVGVLIHHQREHSDFVSSAHELAHLMKVEHDSDVAGNRCFNVQCYAILQPTASFCKNCIVWSARSKKEFQSYVSTNKDRCFLLNQPRSLHQYGVPMKTIGPHQQCICYGYQSHWVYGRDVDQIFSHTCEKKLTCAIQNRQVHCKNPRPVDGTPCGNDKVCWKRKCRHLMKA